MVERTTAADVAALIGGWPARGHGSLANRLAGALRHEIVTGRLPLGTRLPSERQLAAAVAVSRSTVVTALDELRSAGLVESRQGSGTVVADGAAPGTFERPTLAGRVGATDVLNLGASIPFDASALPDVGLSAADMGAVVPTPGYALGGLPSLRARVARHHTDQGLSTRWDQVQVTSGAHQAIAHALAALAPRGSTILVEDPTYPGLADITGRLGLRAVALASGPLGPNPSDLRTEAARLGRRLRALYLVHAVHSPTGRVLDAPHAARLADAVAGLGVPVIEDNTLADLAFAGRRPVSLAMAAPTATVISVESLSKSVWGGLRIGWLRGPASLIERSVASASATDLGPSAPAQLLAEQILDHLQQVTSSRRRLLRDRSRQLEELLAGALPAWEVTRPHGGLSTWVRLPDAADAQRFAHIAARHGVVVAPEATGRDGRARHLRLCHDRPAGYLEAAVDRLVTAWAELVERAPATITA